MSFELWADEERSAWLSPCGQYRYVLTRRWGSGPPATFVMLNPSVADGMQDDQTIRRCVGFAKTWGMGALMVANLYALVSTDPDGLWLVDDPVGPENDSVLRRVAAGAGRADRPVVAAWGMHARPERVAEVLAIPGMDRLLSLGVTKSGAPRHPSRLAYATRLGDWPVAS